MPRARASSESRVGTFAKSSHVDLLAQEREAARVELGEVQDVTDESLESHRLLGDHLERPALRRLVVEDALPQCRHVTANRGQRRAQLVRHRHEEVAGELLRLRQPRGHLVEASGEPLDLTTPGALGHGHVVVARGDLVRRARELLERPGDPARVVEDEDAGDGNPDPEGERELPEQLQPAGAERRFALGDDERSRADLTQRDRLRDAEIVGVAEREVERRRRGAVECLGRHCAARELG